MGDYWTPLIVRELLYGTCRFNQLVRNLPNISRALLASRLKNLERAGVLVCERDSRNATSYTLTDAGRDLQGLVDAMNDWGMRWRTRDTNPRDLDPVLVICMLKDRLRVDQLPVERVVMEICAAGNQQTVAWIVCERGGASMCFDHPGLEIDVWVQGKVEAMYNVWLQNTSMANALARGDIEATGVTQLVAAFPRWFDGQE
jgi:DNA-binding HxlR family transcriptional regulator